MTKSHLLRGAIALALISLSPSLAAAKDWKHVSIAMEGTYPPDNMVGPDGKLTGFEPELAMDLCNRMHITCELSAQDWNSLIPGLNASKFDVIMTGMFITPKRQEVIAFSTPYVQIETSFGVLKGGPLAPLPDTGKHISFDNQAESKPVVDDLRKVLKGKTIGVEVSTIQADMLNKYFKDVAEIRTYPSTDAQDLDLQNGRIDVSTAAATSILGSVDASKGAIVLTGPFVRGDMVGSLSGAGFRKSDADLKAMFDKAIGEALADGTVKRLALKWFKLDVTPR